MAEKILFLTTHNLATNPRLVKEIRLALQNEFQVELICFEFNNWSKQINDQLKEAFREVKMTAIPAGRRPFLPWAKGVYLETFYRKLAKAFSLNQSLLSRAISRRNDLLLKAIKTADKPGWVIGHNPGALYATLYAKQHFNCKAGFDVEDYHPGEGHNRYLQDFTKKLMRAILPKMDYVSFASPLIRSEVEKDVGDEPANWFTILNYFPSTEFDAPLSLEGPLKLVWFSQNISFQRGLEQLIASIKDNDQVELHLFGNCNQSFKEQWLSGTGNIHLHASLPQHELHLQLSKFDVGLAIEPGKDVNNELALSNKMLAYFQSGLYILASNTKAQAKFINEHSGHGLLTSLSPDDLKQSIQNLINQKQSLRASATERFENAKKYCWEKESEKLSRVWRDVCY